MKTIMTREHKLVAYLLNKQFGYTMTSIATLMKVSQSTISGAIKEVNYWKTIQDLTNELIQAQRLIEDQGLTSQNAPIF